MGRGSYTAADWTRLRSSRNLHQQQPVEYIFSRRQADSAYHSKGILFRTSRDPEPDTKATPVIIGFDVTASMGYLASELATNSLHKVMTGLLSNPNITGPQLLCAAIGDCKSDRSPLQVTQFEADIRVIQQLLELHLEGGGGGNYGESYNLLWHFAANHTRHDHYDKRGKKGYLFTIGDDRCHEGLLSTEISACFPTPGTYPVANQALIAKAREKYHIFHIHIDKGNPADDGIFQQWQSLLPGCCTRIDKKDVSCLAELITTLISVMEGETPNQAMKSLDQQAAERIARSVAFIQPPKNTNVISF